MVRWYVIQTPPARERDAADELKRQGFGVFAPRFLQRRIVRGAVLHVPQPLFPGYGFVAIDVGVQRWRSVNGTRNVMRIISEGDYPSDHPIPVPVGIVEGFIKRTGADGFVQMEPWKDAAGKPVVVRFGPFSSCAGLCEQADEKRITVLLNFLGEERSIEMDWLDVEVAS